MHTYHTDIRKQLLAQGYRIIPSRGKVPILHGWNDQDYVAQQLTSGPKGSAAERVSRWEKRFPEAVSTGLRIEDGLGVIDEDIDDPLVDLLNAEIARIAPDVALHAPTRFGGGEHKMALFCQIKGEQFIRIESRRFNGHRVEIFGGAPLRNGNCSRQFGILGPHSFNADGTVAREYLWADGVPHLATTPTGDLPRLTKAQAFEIVAAFEQLAIAAGWTPEARPAVESGGAVYDITPETRFDTDHGGNQISYAELCDEHAAYGDLRCSSSFMAGREGTDRGRCWVFHSPQHNCIAVWVYGDEQAHYPRDMDPAGREEAIAPLLAEAMAAEGVEPPADMPNWRERYAHGAPKATLHNARLAIVAAGFLCSFDVFHNRLFLGRAGLPLPFCGEVTDHGVLGLRVWLSDHYGLDFTERHVRDAVIELAVEGRFNPVTDMLAEAEAAWDGTARLDRMAVDLFNAADTPFNRQAVAKTMIAAVARARNPGCKFDTILTMESPEGWNKSSAWAVLAGDGNFSDESIIGKASREVQEQLAGVWIHENAELAGMRKAEVETVKAYASRQVDRARPAYGRFLIEQPRHSIEVGTTNGIEYLQSQTGNRRFWPVRIERPIDVARLRALRLQLWGEAAARQSAGESLTLDEDLWPAAAVAQEARRVRDAWEDDLAEMSGALAGAGLMGGVVTVVGDEERVSTRAIFEYVLKVPAHLRDDRHAKRLASTMRVLGWMHGFIRIDGKPVRGYWRKQKR